MPEARLIAMGHALHRAVAKANEGRSGVGQWRMHHGKAVLQIIWGNEVLTLFVAPEKEDGKYVYSTFMHKPHGVRHDYTVGNFESPEDALGAIKNHFTDTACGFKAINAERAERELWKWAIILEFGGNSTEILERTMRARDYLIYCQGMKDAGKEALGRDEWTQRQEKRDKEGRDAR